MFCTLDCIIFGLRKLVLVILTVLYLDIEAIVWPFRTRVRE